MEFGCTSPKFKGKFQAACIDLEVLTQMLFEAMQLYEVPYGMSVAREVCV